MRNQKAWRRGGEEGKLNRGEGENEEKRKKTSTRGGGRRRHRGRPSMRLRHRLGMGKEGKEESEEGGSFADHGAVSERLIEKKKKKSGEGRRGGGRDAITYAQ